jgi:hypothetical protein
MTTRRNALTVPLLWIAALTVIGALHVQLNRGGFRHAIQSFGQRDRLQVGHLPVT